MAFVNMPRTKWLLKERSEEREQKVLKEIEKNDKETKSCQLQVKSFVCRTVRRV